MRSSLALFLTLLVTACGSGGSSSFSGGSQPEDGGEGSSSGGSGGSGGGKSTGGGGSGGGSKGGSPNIGEPVQLAQGQTALTGVTSDGWAVYRGGNVLHAVKLEEGGSVETISDRPGTVLIRGRAVFNWADIDWTTNLGELTVWTEAGAEALGEALYAETLVAASESGSAIVYTSNIGDETADLVLYSTELGTSQVLVESMGRGSEETCAANIGFVGERLFVGFCEAGTRAATIERFELDGEEWVSTVIAEDALPNWSADAEGERVFFQSSAYEAYCWMDGEAQFVDRSVSRGLIVPDGSEVFYTVGDQLRRSELPDVDPVPVVTRGYSQPIGYDPRYDHALYSTTVTYEGGTRRDLLLVPTREQDAAPIVLIEEPIAELSRSPFTADGQFVLYFTDRQPTGATLHVVDLEGNERLVLENVVDAVAAYESTIVFADNSSDPETYPVVADLKMIDVANDAEPRLLEGKILDARRFGLADGGAKVVFARSGIDFEPEALERDGLFFMQIR
ncbi:MAG TPA: hypothetical protein VFZ53_16090 [Polyangiaceae bacterium]